MRTLNCDDPQTQREINECARLSYERANEEMNSLYGSLYSRSNSAAQAELAKAQEEWTQFRQSQAELESKPYQGGSAYAMVYFRAMERITRERIAQLQAQLSRSA